MFEHEHTTSNATDLADEQSARVPTEAEELTLSEASALVGKTRQTLRQWIIQGKLQARRIGPYYVVRRSDVERLAESRQRPRSSLIHLIRQIVREIVREEIAQQEHAPTNRGLTD